MWSNGRCCHHWGRQVYRNVVGQYISITPTEPLWRVSSEGRQACVPGDEQWVRGQGFGHQTSGTCSVGESSDELAVLACKFCVHGFNKLRVVDNSVFPRPPGAFPVVSAFLFDEKASKDILDAV
ncbi:hypothetical protein GE09DRAFT_727524 [Coniochaeta sp. 2T2.1]|nr:hypothetical protein GE09DRAFT_727524 [Coniochaeta sp. 2T2.1]